MFNHMHNFIPLMSPEESGNTGSMDKDDVIKFFGEDDKDEKEVIPLDDKTKDKKETVKSKDETDDKTDDNDNEEDDDEVDDETEDDEDDELTEIEEELEEPDEEKLGLVTPVRRKEILAKYPKLFKDFPYLETAYYREQKYTELLPTIDDAKEAVEKASTLDKFESELLNGNTKTMLKAIKNGDDNAFKKVVDNYLTTLSEVDEKAYHHVIGNTIKHTIMQMVSEGRRSSNEALQSAAQILNQFVFGSSDFIPPTQLSSNSNGKSETSDKEIELDRREKEFAKHKFESANNDINGRVNGSYRTTIEANIDPKQTMSDYVRRNASREAFENLDSLIGQDKRFKVLVDKLWENASKTNYSKESTDRIRQAFIAKARTLLPSVIKKARNEALRGMGKRVRDTDESDDTIKTSKKSPIEKEKTHSSSVKSSKSKIPEGMSTLEFLSQD